RVADTSAPGNSLLMVRPEYVSVSDQKSVEAGSNAFPVDVLDVSHLGSSTRVDFRFATGQVGTARLDSDPNLAVRPGQAAWASWRPESQRFVTPDSESDK